MVVLDDIAAVSKMQNEAAKQAFGSWMSGNLHGHPLPNGGNWDVFWTQTLTPRGRESTWTSPGWATAKRAAIAGLHLLNARSWALVFEMQPDRGVPHVHALVERNWPPGPLAGGEDDGLIVDLQETMYHTVGICRLKLYDPAKGASYYIGKYLAKEQSYLSLGFHRENGAKVVLNGA